MIKMKNDNKTIRKATLDDIPVIQSIADIVFPLTYKNIITPEQNDYMMDMMYSTVNLKKQMTEEHHTYLICYIDDKPVGYVSVQPIDKDVYDLQKIYVLPDYQKHHIGRYLFEHAEALIKEMHPEPCRMELHVNRYNVAIKFYEHMGMHELRQGDYDIGHGFYMNDYIMGKDL